LSWLSLSDSRNNENEGLSYLATSKQRYNKDREQQEQLKTAPAPLLDINRNPKFSAHPPLSKFISVSDAIASRVLTSALLASMVTRTAPLAAMLPLTHWILTLSADLEFRAGTSNATRKERRPAPAGLPFPLAITLAAYRGKVIMATHDTWVEPCQRKSKRSRIKIR